MSTNLYLVFSKRPEAVSAADYDRWYETHAQENIESPGFLNARRFELSPGQRRAGARSSTSRVYEYEGAMEQWRAEPQRAHQERRRRAARVVPADPVRQLGLRAARAACSRPRSALAALMDALERLVAIQEIRDQIARYAIFFDDKNWDEFAELWADDAAFVGPGMAFKGKAACSVPHRPASPPTTTAST